MELNQSPWSGISQYGVESVAMEWDQWLSPRDCKIIYYSKFHFYEYFTKSNRSVDFYNL